MFSYEIQRDLIGCLFIVGGSWYPGEEWGDGDCPYPLRPRANECDVGLRGLRRGQCKMRPPEGAY